VKPAPFEYVPARSAAEAVEALAGEGASVLAGGQSLVFEMNFRRARPRTVIDINPAGDLDLLAVEGGRLRVGALARHAAFEGGSGAPGKLGRLLATVARHIAHPPVRARGTMVGSLAHAHPAAEWPAVAVALDAELRLLGTGGPRTVAATEFFLGPFATARGDHELVAEVQLPLLEAGARAGFTEHRRTAASFALVAAVTILELAGREISRARIAVAGAADRPLRVPAVEEALAGRPPTAEAFAEAGRLAAEASDPRPEPGCSVAYRRHCVAVVVARALRDALTDAGGAP